MGLRPGTIPVALIVGFGKACEIASVEYKENMFLTSNNKDVLIKLLQSSHAKYLVNGCQRYCINNTINVSFSNIDSEALIIATKHLCSVANGSACNSNNYEPSYVLTAMNIPQEAIGTAIRLSWGASQLDFEEMKHLLAVVVNYQS